MKKTFLKNLRFLPIMLFLTLVIPVSTYAATERSFFESIYCKTIGSWINDISCSPLVPETEDVAVEEPSPKTVQKPAETIPFPAIISTVDIPEAVVRASQPIVIQNTPVPIVVPPSVAYIPAAFDVSSFVTKEFLARQLDGILDSIDKPVIDLSGRIEEIEDSGGGGGVSDLSAFDTSDLIEGSNLYFTDARVGSYISASTTIPHVAGSSYGDLLFWNGANWNTIATSSLGISVSSQWTTSGSNAYFNTGNIGIGTTSPYAKLSVAGEVVGQYFTATSTNATSTFGGNLSVLATTTSNGFVLNSAKTFYVGNDVLIDALGNLSATVLPLQDTASNLSGIVPLSGEFVYETDTALSKIGNGITSVGSLTPLALGTINSSTQYYVPFYSSTGRTLSGTSTLFVKNQKLGISNTNPQFDIDVTTIGNSIDLSDLTIQAGVNGTGNDADIILRSTSGDNSGISLDASGAISINSSGVGGVGFSLDSDAGITLTTTDSGGFGSHILLMPDSTQSVGIATSSPWRKLSVTGTVGFDGLTGATGAGSICLSAKKELVYNSASDACLPSLKSTKKDIENLSVNALSLIEDLQPATFVYKEGDQRVRYGFIAEDTEDVDDHLVTYNAEGDLSGIDDRAMVSLLVKAVKELKVKVDLFQSSTSSPALSNGSIWDFITEKFSEVAISIKDLVADTLTATLGNFQKVRVTEGIEIKDSETGDIYCLTIKSGETHTEEGECGESDDDSSNDNNDNDDDNDDEEVVDDDQATTTPETSDEEEVEEQPEGDEDDVAQEESPDPELEPEPSPEAPEASPQN